MALNACPLISFKVICSALFRVESQILRCRFVVRLSVFGVLDGVLFIRSPNMGDSPNLRDLDILESINKNSTPF